MRGRLVAVGSFVACWLVTALPALSQASQQQPNTQQARPAARPAPSGNSRPQGQNPGRPSKPGDVSIQPYPNPSRPPNPGQKPPQSGPRPPSKPVGDVHIQPYPNPSRPPNPGPKPPPPGTRPPNPPGPGPRPPRPPGWGKPPQYRPPYQWRPNDWDYLHRYYYRNLGYIHRPGRPVWIAGGFIPYGDISYITALPPNLYGYLPPPPPGYMLGYFQGYVVVYDPRTGFIVNIVDLLR